MNAKANIHETQLPQLCSVPHRESLLAANAVSRIKQWLMQFVSKQPDLTLEVFEGLERKRAPGGKDRTQSSSSRDEALRWRM